MDLPAPTSLPAVPKGAFGRQFLTRMLFSCLVDADRLATARFVALAEDGADIYTPTSPNRLEALRDALDARLARFQPKEHDLARLRARVLEAARAKAERPSGLFTMTVPKGGGKTLSSFAFALDHAIRHGLRRVIYVIPFTAIIEQTAQVFREALGDDDAILEHHSAFDWDALDRNDDHEDRDGAEKLRLASQNWDRPVIVTTVVQFYESLYSNRPSRCRKLHNIARSVIVLDEAQMIPLKVLRPCLKALRTLTLRPYGASVVLCTATQPAVVRARTPDLPEALDPARVCEIAPDPGGLHAALRRVRVEQAGRLADRALAELMARQPQALTILNNRRHARELYGRLDGLEGRRHLTTSMCAAHRRQILAEIRDDLRRKRPVRLVSTSLIECGVDISFPLVLRAMAGLDQIAQAAGRCNREGELGPMGGRVIVFEPEEGEGRAPPPELKQFADSARFITSRHEDPLSLDAIRAYFEDLYDSRGTENLDGLMVEGERGVLAAIKRHCSKDTYPFASTAAAFRLIETATEPVIIPAIEAERDRVATPGAERALLDALEHARFPGGLARRLQPFLVQVPPRARAALVAAGAARVVREQDFGRQFVALESHELYTPALGLDWDDPTWRSAEANVF